MLKIKLSKQKFGSRVTLNQLKIGLEINFKVRNHCLVSNIREHNKENAYDINLFKTVSVSK